MVNHRKKILQLDLGNFLLYSTADYEFNRSHVLTSAALAEQSD